MHDTSSLLLSFTTRKLYMNQIVDKTMIFNEVPTLALQEINSIQSKVLTAVLLMKTF